MVPENVGVAYHVPEGLQSQGSVAGMRRKGGKVPVKGLDIRSFDLPSRPDPGAFRVAVLLEVAEVNIYLESPANDRK